MLTAEVYGAWVIEAVWGLGATCCIELATDCVAVWVQAVVLFRFSVELLRFFAWPLASSGVDSATRGTVFFGHQHRFPWLINQALGLPRSSVLILILQMKGCVRINVLGILRNSLEGTIKPRRLGWLLSHSLIILLAVLRNGKFGVFAVLIWRLKLLLMGLIALENISSICWGFIVEAFFKIIWLMSNGASKYSETISRDFYIPHRSNPSRPQPPLLLLVVT